MDRDGQSVGEIPDIFRRNEGRKRRRALREALEGESPIGLLIEASGYVESATPRVLDRLDEDAPVERLPLGAFASWANSGVIEFECLAAAAAVLHPGIAALGVGAVDVPSVPEWLATMGDITITAVVGWSWPDEPGESIVIEWCWPDGSTAMVFVAVDLDHGASFAAIDAADGGLAGALEQWAHDGYVSPVPIEVDPASARARIEQIVAMSEYDTDNQPDGWPRARPFLEWVLRHLSEGGQGYERVAWRGYRVAFLVDEFMASPFVEGFALGIDEAIDLMELVTEFRYEACDGDPLRWTVDQVETLLLEWFPPYIEGVEAYIMFDLPDVLASFVRYVGRLSSAEPSDTAQLVQTIEQCRRPYLEAVLSHLDPLDDAEEFNTFLDLLADAQERRWG